MNLSRRHLLKSSLLTVPGLLLFEKLSFAQSLQSEPHFFVMLRAAGGLDATLGLDPQLMPRDAGPSDLFLEYRPEDIVKAQEIKLGPAAKSLVPFANKCAVINGVMMKRDAGHETILQYMSSGRGDGSLAIFPVELAATYGGGPYGVIFTNSAYTASRTVALSSPDDILNEAQGPSLLDLLKPLQPRKDQKSHLSNTLRGIIGSGDITAKLIKNIALVVSDHADAKPSVQATLAAFLSGASQQAILDITEDNENLDTHSGHEKEHLRLQTKVWERVADIFSRFEKTPFLNGSLMDHTTFMVVTEFSRTPYLNGAKGKDHNADTNSILLAGKGIQGGKTFGSSKVIPAKKSVTGLALHIATAIDAKTGLPADGPNGATFIFPENIFRTLSDVFGKPKGLTLADQNLAPIKGLVRL